MSWSTSNRRGRLPYNWAKIRQRILERDGYQCRAMDVNTGQRCTSRASEVDHIRAGDDHSDSNLRSLCRWHHGKKSAQEGAQAAQRARQQTYDKFSRKERHPGDLT